MGAVEQLLKLILIFTPAILLVVMISEIIGGRRKSVKKSPFKQIRYSLTKQQQLIEKLYFNEQMEREFEKAGNPAGLSAWQFRFYRDIIFAAFAIYKLLRFAFVDHVFPWKGLAGLALLYFLCSFGFSFTPLRWILKYFNGEMQRKRNDAVNEVFILLHNDYMTESEDNFQSVQGKLRDLKQYVPVIGKDIDRLLFKLTVDGDTAFTEFGQRIGTKEAESLASLLKEINRSSPAVAVDLLSSNQETFRKIRQQRRRRRLKANGYLGHAIVFTAIVAIVYFINVVVTDYKNILMDAIYTNP